jgi:hypothetical protein
VPEVPLYTGDDRQMAEDLRIVGRNKLAEKITGGLSYPSKMDAPAWGIPVEHCQVGALLAKVKGAVCKSCYAAKGTFRFRGTREKMRRAYEGLLSPLWTPAMVQQINWHASERFRWFMAGDLQGISHLRNIIRVCLETPEVLHWLPTRERETVLACRDEIPENLTIRASGTMVDGPPPSWWPVTSSVSTREEGRLCPSSSKGGNCGEHQCTACWDPSVGNVVYTLH